MNFRSVTTQLELPIERPFEKDRNYHLGGRSFYFFDFDDNIAVLMTPMVLFHKETGEEILISTEAFSRELSNIGRRGIYRDYEIRMDEDGGGSFRNFRDCDPHELERRGLRRQIFLQDVLEILGGPDVHWKGPSWSCFFHATFNQRPVSVITARGHAPETIQEGIDLFVDSGHLPRRPNYLSLFPVNHPPTRRSLGDEAGSLSVAELKRAAIRASVERAIEKYGYSPHHRFGMSDDDRKNLQLIYEEMCSLKSRYPELSFFLIETEGGRFLKHEVMISGVQTRTMAEEAVEQLVLGPEEL